ncbi:hypothetical protein P7C73_g669, partial [Tremellales sp. Uapishka_1]
MSSFLALKASRQARQRTLASQASQLPISTTSQKDIAVEEAQIPESEVDKNDLNREIYGEDLGDLVVRSTEDRGRGLYVPPSRSCKAGSSLLQVKPVVSVLSTPHLSKRCSTCFLSPSELSIATNSPPPTLKRCTGCKVLHYCSATCQKVDWEIHAFECRALRRTFDMWRSTYPTKKDDGSWIMKEGIRALGRICWKRQKMDKAWWEPISRMESHRSKFTEEEYIGTSQLVQLLLHYLSASEPPKAGSRDLLHPADPKDYGFDNLGDTLDLCSAFAVNSFTLSSPSLSPIGVSTSPIVALCNHSCQPNAVVVFPGLVGGEMNVVAIRDLAPGEEILTSYIDVSIPFADRQLDLSKRYGFTCQCQLCRQSEDMAWVDPRWCVRHVGCRVDGKGRMPNLTINGDGGTTCDACRELFQVDTSLIRGAINMGKGLLSEDEEGELGAADLPKIVSILKPLLHLLPASSYPNLPLLQLSSLISPPPTSLLALNHSTQTSRSIYDASVQVFPAGHPNLAVILAQWAKISAVEITDIPTKEEMRRLQGTVETAGLAWKAARRGFGEAGGLLGVEMKRLGEGCQRELEILGQ